MDGKTIEYVDEFIFETCRGEWDHWMNCLFVIVALIINPLFLGLIVAAVTLLCNLPFIAIQRYNRFRLQTLRKQSCGNGAGRGPRAGDGVTTARLRLPQQNG